jgi:hypothetical protein
MAHNDDWDSDIDDTDDEDISLGPRTQEREQGLAPHAGTQRIEREGTY